MWHVIVGVGIICNIGIPTQYTHYYIVLCAINKNA